MRIAHTFALLTTMALTALALTGTNAAAQESGIEIDKEDGANCTTTTCIVHATGTSELHQHTFGGENQISACNDEFRAELNHTADPTTGIIGHMFYENDHVANSTVCTRIPCADPAENEFNIFDPGENTANAGHMWVRFCVESEGGSEFHCDVEIELDEESANNHHYTFTAANEPCSLNVELTGTWETEATPNCAEGESDVEIVHS